MKNLDASSFGLKTQTIEQITQIFKKYPEINEAVIYGSRAMGTQNPGSDIDLTLKGDALDLTILNKIKNELDDSSIPFLVDLSIMSKIENQELVEHIKRVGKTFWCRTP